MSQRGDRANKPIVKGHKLEVVFLRKDERRKKEKQSEGETKGQEEQK